MVWSDCQEYNGFIFFVFAKTVHASLDMSTFFTDNKDNPKISINPRTPATSQVYFSGNSSKTFWLTVWIFKNLFDPSFNALTKT